MWVFLPPGGGASAYPSAIVLTMPLLLSPVGSRVDTGSRERNAVVRREGLLRWRASKSIPACLLELEIHSRGALSDSGEGRAPRNGDARSGTRQSFT
jgi:hypothetical protein